MLIRAKCVLGIRDKDGNSPIWPGCTAEVDDAAGKLMVEKGSAVEVTNPGGRSAGKAAPALYPGENPPEGENAWKGPSEGSGGDVDLEAMTYTELKAMAKEMGIETGKLKSKAQMIDAITGVSEFPNLTPQEVIEE